MLVQIWEVQLSPFAQPVLYRSPHLMLVCWSVAADSTIVDKSYRLINGTKQILGSCHFMYTE
jgi:hypothetical protein